MANPGLSNEKLRESLIAYRDAGNSYNGGAKIMGMDRRTFTRRIERAQRLGIKIEEDKPPLELPELESGELSVEEKLDWAEKVFTKKAKALKSHKWAQIRVNDTRPFAIGFIGDPHLDSSGCDIGMVRKHVKLFQETDGLYAVNLGDTLDNWVGRLMALYSHSANTETTGIEFMEWFIESITPKWLAIIRGNHDMWTASRKKDPLHWVKRGGAPVKDWSYQFEIVTPKGAPIRIHAAHSFKGNSYLNKLHGVERRNRETHGEADIYVQGHHHECAVKQEENEFTGHVHWFLKARGYKYVDTYATVHGYGVQEHGATVTAVIDPMEENPVRRIHCFVDLEEAVEFLNWKRSRTNG